MKDRIYILIIIVLVGLAGALVIGRYGIVREVVVECTPEQRKTEVCTAIYQPVCGLVNVQCVTTPCPPIDQTFSNSCEACKSPLVESYTEGACEG